jgi:hypothetical protein
MVWLYRLAYPSGEEGGILLVQMKSCMPSRRQEELELGGSRHHVQFYTCIPYLQYMINELSSPQVNRSGQTTKMSLTLYTLLIVWRMTFVLTKKKKKRWDTGRQRMLTRTYSTLSHLMWDSDCIHWQIFLPLQFPGWDLSWFQKERRERGRHA